jgi:hypothetical protein
MASPPIPPTFDQLDGKRFSFYPPIVGIEHNEWTYSKSNWSEVLVVNTGTAEEIWISRHFVGEVSRTEDPVVIVGLNRELEYTGGMLRPFQRRVLSMPGAGEHPEAAAAKPETTHWMEVHGIRLEGSDKRILRFIGIATACFLGVYLLFIGFNQWGSIRQGNVRFTASDTAYQELTARDDYFGIIRKLGRPGVERSREVGTIQFEALSYPKRHYTVILMGPEVQTMVYVGTVDDNWRPVHSVPLRGGSGSTDALLRNIQRF